MAASIKYACTALQATGKKGDLKPDEDGYFYLCLGALNFYNAAGIWYDWEASKHLFDDSATFIRRITDGCVYSERDHPEWKDGMSFDAYVRRIKKIEMSNTVAHIRKIEIKQEGTDNEGRPIMVIYGWVRPEEDYEAGRALKSALLNKHQNVCFSIRSLCEDTIIRGKVFRVITEVVTFDWVVEPGISLAKKWNSPALESGLEIPLDVIKRAIANNDERAKLGLENSDDFDALREAVKRVEKANVAVTRPSGLKWD